MLLEWNRHILNAAHGIPFMLRPPADILGRYDTGLAVQAILKGMIDQDQHEDFDESCTWIQGFQHMPETKVVPPIDLSITLSKFRRVFKYIEEGKSASPSQLYCGHYKPVSTNGRIIEIHAAIARLSFRYNF